MELWFRFHIILKYVRLNDQPRQEHLTIEYWIRIVIIIIRNVLAQF